MEFRDRVVLVIDDRPDAVIGLRDRIPPERAVLRRADPADAAAELPMIDPHPFAVVGVTREVAPALPDPLVELLATAPVPVLWWGQLPDALPPHSMAVGCWAELRDAAVALLASAPGGVALADHRGLVHRERIILSARLEGLVAAYPLALPLAPRAMRSTRMTIARHDLPLRVTWRGRHRGALEVAA